MITIAKSFEFAASHRLYRPEWSDQRNREVFGKCANPNGHGHNYRLEVQVSGEINQETGMVVDASKLDALVGELVLADVDHRHLNLDVEWLKGKMVSVENIIEAIWQRLEPEVRKMSPTAHLEKLILHETARIYATRSRDR